LLLRAFSEIIDSRRPLLLHGFSGVASIDAAKRFAGLAVLWAGQNVIFGNITGRGRR
jgi:hypothetical protein